MANHWRHDRDTRQTTARCKKTRPALARSGLLKIQGQNNEHIITHSLSLLTHHHYSLIINHPSLSQDNSTFNIPFSLLNTALSSFEPLHASNQINYFGLLIDQTNDWFVVSRFVFVQYLDVGSILIIHNFHHPLSYKSMKKKSRNLFLKR